MLGEKHHLALEFPEYRYQIHVLKTTDSHFARLHQEYNDLDDEIRRTELEIEAHSDEFLESLKLRRLQLKDELYGMLQKASE
ncbi:YdcH family protein [Methylomicrobium lacus]|uniref:YdcH family protein n=1 Tax=Methylomicrobium lacus TaxID=136992 RepID=UPI00045EAFAE|nr:YdcH family protein [Methylomicrobium lacus]